MGQQAEASAADARTKRWSKRDTRTEEEARRARGVSNLLYWKPRKRSSAPPARGAKSVQAQRNGAGPGERRLRGT